MTRRTIGLLALVLSAGLVVPTSVAARPVGPPRAPVPATTCSLFPFDNVWNMDISKLPVHARSDVWKKAMHAGKKKLHPDFGPPSYGIPFNVVGGGAPKKHIDFTYASESDPGPYPFRGATPIEGGSDRHALTVDSDNCVLYELFNARWNGGNPTAGSGAIFDLNSNVLRHAGWTSADAAGLPILPGLVRYDEVLAGYIGHAIRVTSDCTSRNYLWPARHQAGVRDPRCPPMGARFRLKAGFDVSSYSKNAKVVLDAFKHFGLIVADNGSDWYFQGTVDDRLDERPDGSVEAGARGGVRRRERGRMQGVLGQRPVRLRPEVPVAQPDLADHWTRPNTARSLVCVSAPSGGTTVLPYTP